MKPHRATTVLVFGILSLVICAPLGIAAWVMGNNDLREMDHGLMDPGGRDSTSAGRVCGIIGTILFILGLLVMVLWFSVVGVAVFAASQEAQNRQHIEFTPALPQPAR
jgi:hypothetical protein